MRFSSTGFLVIGSRFKVIASFSSSTLSFTQEDDDDEFVITFVPQEVRSHDLLLEINRCWVQIWGPKDS